MTALRYESTVPEPEPRVRDFERMAFGAFVNFNLYSVLGKGGWGIPHVSITQKDLMEYYDSLKEKFTAADFDAHAVARLAKESGVKYLAVVARLHEGFSLYDTRGLTDFDALHSPARRDLVAEFMEGCRAEGIVPFIAHALLDWRWNSRECDETAFNEYLDYLHASIEILCKHYGAVGGFWLDGTWSRRQSDWKMDRLYAMIREHQPDAVIINNTGRRQPGELEHPEVDCVTFEQWMPKPTDRRGQPKYVAAEMCEPINRHWGIATLDFNYKSTALIIEHLASCRRVRANYLTSLALTDTGAIGELQAATLRTVGKWVAMYALPIYEGRPVAATCVERDFILGVDDRLFYFAFDLSPKSNVDVTLATGTTGPRPIKGLDRPIRHVRWIDNDEALNYVQDVEKELAVIDLTPYPTGSDLVVRVAEIQL